MVGTATITIRVQTYGTWIPAAVLTGAKWLVPVSPRLAVAVATFALHWLVWARIDNGRLFRLGKSAHLDYHEVM